jgi:D-lactate dehydrogenase
LPPEDVLARLLMSPNVIVTAHEAFFTHETMTDIAQATFANIAAWHAGTPRNVVPAA